MRVYPIPVRRCPSGRGYLPSEGEWGASGAGPAAGRDICRDPRHSGSGVAHGVRTGFFLTTQDGTRAYGPL
jgi:hypothetical protein